MGEFFQVQVKLFYFAIFTCMKDQTGQSKCCFIFIFGGHRTTTWIAMGTLQSREKWELILKKINVHGSLFKLCTRYPQSRCKY